LAAWAIEKFIIGPIVCKLTQCGASANQAPVASADPRGRCDYHDSEPSDHSEPSDKPSDDSEPSDKPSDHASAVGSDTEQVVLSDPSSGLMVDSASFYQDTVGINGQTMQGSILQDIGAQMFMRTSTCRADLGRLLHGSDSLTEARRALRLA